MLSEYLPGKNAECWIKFWIAELNAELKKNAELYAELKKMRY